MADFKDRTEFVNWIKERALRELQYAGPTACMSSVASDFSKSEQFTDSMQNPAFQMLFTNTLMSNSPEQVKKFVEGIT